MNVRIVAYVGKVLCDCFGNADFVYGHPQRLHQRQGIAVGAPCCAHSRHRHCDNLAAIDAQLVECAHTNEERQRGVESSTDAYDHRLGMGVGYALAESQGLDAEYFLA